MEKEILEEIEKGLNRKEKVILRMFDKIFIKVYNNVRIEIINKMIL